MCLLFQCDNTLRVYDIFLTFTFFGNSMDDHIEDAGTRHTACVLHSRSDSFGPRLEDPMS